MSVIQPTNSTGLIIDDFINYANAHLSTISGIINTISLDIVLILKIMVFYLNYMILLKQHHRLLIIKTIIMII